MKFQAKLEKAETIEDCGASKECDESQVLLRVKDPLAALYPFVGIVAEVRGTKPWNTLSWFFTPLAFLGKGWFWYFFPWY